jgi:deoxyribonuclease IV
LILGLHCSVVSGFAAALDEAASHGCAAMQTLPYKRHHAGDAEGRSALRKARAGRGIGRHLAHSRFVPSLASSDDARWVRSIELLRHELSMSAELGAEAYVIHAGAYSPGADLKEGVERFAEGLARAAAGAEPLSLLLENVPGGGRRMGGSLEELALIVEAAARKRLSVRLCLDTAHAWAAGYDLSSAEGMLKFVAKVNRLLGSENVGAFHLNDTRALLGSNREHHWHWGEGYLGTEGLKALLERPEFAETLGILETPKGEDARNLRVVRRLL